MLQPGAEEKGASYAGVLTRAKERIIISELRIPALKVRKAATGARILKIASREKVDLLAAKLKKLFQLTA